MHKIFISYSHDDSAYFDQVHEHLKALGVNETQLEIWSDERIAAGSDWFDDIKTAIDDASLILMLISSSFLASEFIKNEEIPAALERQEKHYIKVIPLIIRDCAWKTHKWLSKMQLRPQDKHRRITSLASMSPSDRDSALARLSEEIDAILKNQSEVLHQIVPNNHKANTSLDSLLQQNFLDQLNDTEIIFAHRHADSISLDDLFVFPDLKKLKFNSSDVVSTLNSSDIKIITGWNILFGDEQSGKTALSKRLVINALDNQLSPVLLTGHMIKASNIDKLLSIAIKKQYKISSLEELYSIGSDIVIIIDDYTEMDLNHKYHKVFLENLKSKFQNIVILADESFKYVAHDIQETTTFHRYEILPFGNERRSELIDKWVSLGRTEEIDESELYKSIDELKTHLDSFVRNNIVPAKPLFLLTILQTFESHKPLEMTTYGHCYQMLIYQALEQAKIHTAESDPYINYMTELAGYFLMTKTTSMPEEQLSEFHSEYESKFLVTESANSLKNKLIASKIISFSDESFSFKYRYIYYFYAAKYLAEQLGHNDSSKNLISELIENLHRESSANIIIFMTYHTKDQWILDEIQFSLMELFEAHEPEPLTIESLKFMNEFIDEIPHIVLEQIDTVEARKKVDLHKDKTEKIEAKLNEHLEGLEPSDLLARVNRVLKGMELIGQIIRNRHGSLHRDLLRELLNEAFDVGLRFLGYFLALTNNTKKEIIGHIENILIEHPNITNDALEKKAKNFFLHLTYRMIYGMLRKISFSVGAKELIPILEEIEKERECPAVKLIIQSIKLQFAKQMNVNQLEKLSFEFKHNIVCDRLLKEIVIQHIYMHHIDSKKKQQVSEKLGISVQKQILIESKKQFGI